MIPLGIQLLICYLIVLAFCVRLVYKKWPKKHRPLFWLLLGCVGLYSIGPLFGIGSF